MGYDTKSQCGDHHGPPRLLRGVNTTSSSNLQNPRAVRRLQAASQDHSCICFRKERCQAEFLQIESHMSFRFDTSKIKLRPIKAVGAFKRKQQEKNDWRPWRALDGPGADLLHDVFNIISVGPKRALLTWKHQTCQSAEIPCNHALEPSCPVEFRNLPSCRRTLA